MAAIPPETSAAISSKIQSILQSKQITDPVTEVVCGNHGSSLQTITVKFKDDCEKKQLSLYVKYSPTTMTANGVLQLQVYQKSITFFKEYLPEARKFCKSLGLESLIDIYPKWYHADGDMLVLENWINERGPPQLDSDNLVKLDFETAKFVLVNLAKHHAISLTLVDKYGGPGPFIERFPPFICEPFRLDLNRAMFSPGWGNAIDVVIKILKHCDMVGGRTRVLDKFISFKTTDFLLSDNKTIHLQRVKHVSFVVDLCYYLFSSVQRQVRRERFGELLRSYLDALLATTNQLGHKYTVTIEELQTEFDRQYRSGFWQDMEVAMEVGQEILKELGDVSHKWMKENPEECAKVGEKVVKYWEEYERFVQA